MRPVLTLPAGFAVVFAVLATGAAAAAQETEVEWPYYGGDPGGTRFSTLTDIDRDNIDRLEVVWEWRHWETALEEWGTRPGFFESTPLMIDGVVYVTTPYNNVAALYAETGDELWRFDGEGYKLGQLLSASGFKLRGTAFWRDDGRLYIFLNSRHRLFLLDAYTGEAVRSFGDGGAVSLTDGLPHLDDVAHMSQSSPPVVFEDLVIVGSQIPDRVQIRDPNGYVQAFDAHTGERVWTFSVVPESADAPGAETWESESWRMNGHGNVWAPMTLDEERGLLYLPTSTPSSDFYGGDRPGANLFAESIVCLDARTGELRWYFQTVHHGLWDWDVPAPPNLVTITVDGREIDAVAQVTKRGDTFVFDRVTGAPVWPIEERRVPTDSNVPGEQPYPTQPFPTRPPPFVAQGVRVEDANDLTPEIQRLARERMQRFRIGPIFTPPSLEGTLQRPALAGGANWGGAAFDPESGYLFVRGANVVSTNRVGPNDGSNPLVPGDYSNVFAAPAASVLPGNIPLVSPPYAVLAAIDLNRGEIAWSVPVGEGDPGLRSHPLLEGVDLPERLGSPNNRGGAMVTRSGLVFIGGGDGYLYAFDKGTGAELWRGAIPYENTGIPMTYRTESGRQYVVVATGSGEDNALVAFALAD